MGKESVPINLSFKSAKYDLNFKKSLFLISFNRKWVYLCDYSGEFAPEFTLT